ncbi:helix-turn-helix domain-containing protein [Blastococcus haudaquaticus]|uniref:PucR C-terminal helix-turn-helix domain-containing protein n=1 Tax=Blastococcus haudaquaticus TaxID=1938745 RepID=A0A286GT69_9ACTN|nr:helix-turn-helix domain-containing protein [Blastococcus haudaquaticus]SOD98728.1 PucR C-terminal helix-turn-helix domain-containing protein [Blastococcus haudaquaticus]
MNDLALRLAALDPEAGAAVRVIGHFDALTEARADLRSIVRDAAGLAGCPARLVDPARGLLVRVPADGAVNAASDPVVDPAWPSTPVPGTDAVLWLEQPGPPGTVQAVVLERAAAAVRTVLQRTRSRRPVDDPASVELVLDATAPESDRLAAARRLGVATTGRAVALAGGRYLVVGIDGVLPEGVRAGVGPAAAVVDLPASGEHARLALRLTAEGTEDDPGPRVVHADQLGALPLLVRAADGAAVPDVRALEHAATIGPWALATLDAVASATSLRDAARALHLHHSTLQDRLSHAETALGWDVREPAGRLRLQLALVLRRAARHQR